MFFKCWIIPFQVLSLETQKRKVSNKYEPIKKSVDKHFVNFTPQKAKKG